MTPSENCYNLIRKFEGCRSAAYQDQGGIWTIGVGHTGPEVVEGLTWTDQQIEDALTQDAQWAALAVNNLVKATINQNQFDALVSFTFNLGTQALAGSTMLRMVNLGNFPAASAQFTNWDHIHGVTIPGLLNRRMAERNLFNAAQVSV
jgi:lysozyme